MGPNTFQPSSRSTSPNTSPLSSRSHYNPVQSSSSPLPTTSPVLLLHSRAPSLSSASTPPFLSSYFVHSPSNPPTFNPILLFLIISWLLDWKLRVIVPSNAPTLLSCGQPQNFLSLSHTHIKIHSQSLIPKEPWTFTAASHYAKWHAAMASEFDAFLQNHTSDLFPLSPT